MDKDNKKQKIVEVTRYEELEQTKKEIVSFKIKTAICAITFVIGIIGKVSLPWMAFLTGVSAYEVYKLMDAIDKKAGIEKAIPLEEKRRQELANANNESNDVGVKR